MAERTMTTWTCERCTKTETFKQGEQPRFWVRITKAQPPRHAEPARMGDLCIDCRNELDRWWRSWEPPANENATPDSSAQVTPTGRTHDHPQGDPR